MSLAMLHDLRHRYPFAHITWVSGKTSSALVQSTKLVDQLIEIDEAQLFGKSLWRRMGALAKIWRTLSGRFFNLILTAHSDPRYRWISLFCRCTEHQYYKRRTQRPIPLPGRYHLHEYVRLSRDTEVPFAVSLPTLHIPSSSLRDAAIKALPKKQNVILCPGGAKNPLADDTLRRWPIHHYAKLMELLSHYPLNLIVTGAESDRWVEPHFAHLQYINWIGQWQLLDLIALFQHANLIITHDSGPLHLAKFASCPKLALFGPTNPFEKVGASENIHVLWAGGKMACCPCYDGKKYAKCLRNDCLESISPEEVKAQALALLHKPALDPLPVLECTPSSYIPVFENRARTPLAASPLDNME